MKPSSPTRCFAPARRRQGGVVIIAMAMLLVASPTARADSILLRGGERLIGRILAEDERNVRFDSQTLGVLEIHRDRIERVERDAPPPPPSPAEVEQPKTMSPAEEDSKVPPAQPVPVEPAVAGEKDKDSILPAPPSTPAIQTEAATAAAKENLAPEATPKPVGTTSNQVVGQVGTGPVSSQGQAVPTVSAVAPGQDSSAISATPVAKAPAGLKPSELSAAAVVAPGQPSTAVQVVTVEPAPPSPKPAAAAITVFYPWTGLLTEQDTYDWVQLKSGEWLKGKIHSLYEEKLEFDSEEMELKEFDWEDVRVVRSPRLNSMRFEKSGTADGSLLITDNVVRVVSQGGTNTYARTDLISITPTGKSERNKWSGDLAAGINLRSGNTKETSYNVHANLKRRTPVTRLALDYLGNFSHINGVTSEDNSRIQATFDYFTSRRLYIRLPDAEYYADPLQNIQGRLTLGASVGYDIIRKPRLEWDVSAGPAYQGTTFSSVESGSDTVENSFTGVVSTHLDYSLTKRVDWIIDYRLQFASEKAGGIMHHFNSTLEFEIHKFLNLDISFIWDRVGSPTTLEDGTTPLPDDFRLTTSVSIEF